MLSDYAKTVVLNEGLPGFTPSGKMRRPCDALRRYQSATVDIASIPTIRNERLERELTRIGAVEFRGDVPITRLGYDGVAAFTVDGDNGRDVLKQSCRVDRIQPADGDGPGWCVVGLYSEMCDGWLNDT